MQVVVQGLGQELSFQSGIVQNHLVLEFPDGRVVKAAVDADTAAYVTASFVKSGGAAAQRALDAAEAESMPRRQQARSNEMPGNFAPVTVEDESVFGGDYAADTTAEEEWQDPNETVAAPPAIAKLTERRTASALRVSADALGNPVIQGGNVVDQKELTGGIGADDDEDGVGSV